MLPAGKARMQGGIAAPAMDRAMATPYKSAR